MNTYHLQITRSSATGFTLLELLVALAIVGIVSAIAVPQYSDYKKRGFDMRAQSDLRHVAMAEEVYFLDHEQYLTCADDKCMVLPGVSSLSAGVSLSVSATEHGFSGTAHHPQGTGTVYTWDSEAGGFQN